MFQIIPPFSRITLLLRVLLSYHQVLYVPSDRVRGWTVPPPPPPLLSVSKQIPYRCYATVLNPSLDSRRRLLHLHDCASSNDSYMEQDEASNNNTLLPVVPGRAVSLVPRIALRNATIDDLPLLLPWDEKEHLQGSWSGDPEFNDWNWEYELRRSNVVSWRYQLIVEAFVDDDDNNDDDDDDDNNDTIPIGFVQIIDPLVEETHYWGIDCEPNLRAIDIWIGNERYINSGYGTQIMKQVLQSSFVFGDSSVTAVIIDPIADNYRAHRFYQHKLGFRPIGIRHFGPDRCLIHRMNRTEYYLAHSDRILDDETSTPAF